MMTLTGAATVGALGAVLFGAALNGKQVGELKWRALHHAYYGLPLLVLGLALGWLWLAWTGAFLLLDDGVQHGLQRLLNVPNKKLGLVDWLVLPVVWRLPGVARLANWAEPRFTALLRRFQ